MASAGGLGNAPSKSRNGSAVSPPRIRVRARVPPWSFVAPMVTVRTAPAGFSLWGSIVIEDLLRAWSLGSSRPAPARREGARRGGGGAPFRGGGEGQPPSHSPEESSPPPAELAKRNRSRPCR